MQFHTTSSAARIAAERLNENGYKTTPKAATSGSPFSVICFETEAEKACRGKPGAGADQLLSMTHDRRRQLPKKPQLLSISLLITSEF